MKNKRRIPLLISICCILLTVGLYFLKPPFFHFVELTSQDLRFRYRGPLKAGKEIVLVTIDERSLDELGRWPWPRSTIAELIPKLKKADAKVIALDIVFSEPDQHSELQTILSVKKNAEAYKVDNQEFFDALREQTRKADTDAILTAAIEASENIVTGYFFHTVKGDKQTFQKNNCFTENTAKFVYPFYTQATQSSSLHTYPITLAHSLELNLPSFTSASALSGYFNIIPGSDGVVRSIDLVTRYQEAYLLPLSLQAVRHYLDYPELELRFHEGGIEKIRLGEREIPCDFRGKLLINYRGEKGTFKHFSFTDIIHDRIPPQEFADKIVIVGATATGIYDIRTTPFDTTFPGIEVHANVIDMILKGDFLSQSPWTRLADILIIILMGILAWLLLRRSKAFMGGIVTASLFFGYLALACFLFNSSRVSVNTVYPGFLIIILYFSTTLYHYLVEEREKKRIKATFQHYLAPTVVEEILKNPDNLKLGGEEQELTILFSDLRNFTSISEKLSPRQIEELLNEYFTIMTDVIFTHNGTLDKYMGDAIMAFFGAPLKQPDHYVKACMTALAMQQELNTLQQKWKQQSLQALDSGIGINTGSVVVGNMGSDVLFDYTVIGDNVNLASRLESLNKIYGTNIIISENTHGQVKDAFRFRELDLVKVKGKENAVRIYELLREEDISVRWNERFIKYYQEGLEQYRYREWRTALETFEKALALFPDDGATKLYINRCQMFEEDPPPADWDGFIKPH